MDALLNALMVAESGGNPNAISSAGAEGAYQIMPSTAADPGFGVSPMEGSRFDPEASRGFARQYLQAMIDRYLGDIEVALIAYNAGAANADKFVAAGRDYSVLPQAAQTEPYVRKVMGQMQAQDNAESPNRNVNPREDVTFQLTLILQKHKDLWREVKLWPQKTQRLEQHKKNPDGEENVSPGLAAAERRRTLRENPAIGSLREVGRLQEDQQQQEHENEIALLNAAQARQSGGPGNNVSPGITNAQRRRTLRENPAIGSLREVGRQQDQSAEGALEYLQNIGAQQEDRRARFDRAFPDVQPAVARAEQEKEDGGIGYLRRLARKQEAKKQEGRRAARYLAMMEDSQNRINAADPAGRTEGQETPAADPDVLQYLAMLQENQNMVDAAGMPGEEETEDVTTLIAGRGFNNGGRVRGFAGPDGSVVGNSPTILDVNLQYLDEDDPLYIHTDPTLEEQLLEAGIDPGIAEGGLSPILRRMGESLRRTGENMPNWVGSEGRRRLQEEQRARELEEQFPGLESDQVRAIIATEAAGGELYQPGDIKEGEFVPTPTVPPTPVTVPEPEPEPEEVVEEDTGIKPDWNMLREWGAGGMGATNLADALGGSGRAVGAEIARQDKAALEERILTVKEAQMQIDKEIALAVSQQRMTSDVLDAIADLRSEPQIYYSRIGAQMGGITIDEVRERLQESDPAAIAAQMAVERQVMQTAGIGGLGSSAPPVDIVAEATALNEGS